MDLRVEPCLGKTAHLCLPATQRKEELFPMHLPLHKTENLLIPLKEHADVLILQ